MATVPPVVEFAIVVPDVSCEPSPLLPGLGLPQEASIKAAQMLGEYNDRLASIPHTDEAALGDIGRDASGALSAWAKLDSDTGDHLHGAAGLVSRSAQIRRRGVPDRRPHAATMGTATVLLYTRTGVKGQVAGALRAKQIFITVSVLRDL